MKALFGFEGV